MNPRFAVVLIPLLLPPAVAAGSSSSAVEPYRVIEGIASAAWGDPHPALGGGSPIRLTVLDAQGVRHAFVLPPGSPALDFEPGLIQGRRMRVLVDPRRGAGAEPAGVLVLEKAPPGALELDGSQPWISLLCKFANVAAEPKPLSYFTQMFANSPGRLDHYWRELSYNIIDVVGSGAYGWVVLPSDHTVYVPTPGSGCLDGDPNNDADLDLLFTDCTGVADPFIDFSMGGTATGYAGINLMFNGDLDGCAWGGSKWATLDGISKAWRSTWEPPWGYEDVAPLAHEMGHGFGLPHSNNWDNDGWPYDNAWDVMSDAWSNTMSDPTYGLLGKHTIAYHKNLLAWFTAGEVWTPPFNGVFSIVVSDHALPTALGYRMAKLPIPTTTRYWTLETRDRTGTYDGNLPGHAVVVHEIYTSRPEDAWCYETTPFSASCNGPNAMWTAGETFQDPTAGRLIAARVDAPTADGFALTIWYGVPTTALFLDGFETGDTTRWSAAQP
ncbi:MAG: hypothetical protein F9K18_03720 [Thermoanaerobaculia bacterium]|nr:MAG: hypothetical protein F9K18_03720 [Thermoanaerobaculia bacterium]